MFQRCAVGLAIAIVLVSEPVPVCAQVAVAYRVDELVSSGTGDLVGLAINNNGEIAGYGVLPNGTTRAFRWTEAGGLEDLGANGGWLSQAIGINDNGDVVGVYIDSSNNPHGFLAKRGGVMQDLRTPGRQIVRVNSITNDGQMTGQLFSSMPPFQVHAFRTLADGTLQDLGDPLYASVGWRINAAGEVTGYEASTVDGTAQAAFRFSAASGRPRSERSEDRAAAACRSTRRVLSLDGPKCPHRASGPALFVQFRVDRWKTMARSPAPAPRAPSRSTTAGPSSVGPAAATG
jgi:probable HAF family extracellular repeat protein